MKYRPRHIIEYAGLRVVSATVIVLPYHLALGVGWVLAWMAFHLVGFRVKEATSRIEEVFGDRFDAGERREIAWGSFRNMAFNAVEIMRIPSVTKAWVEAVTDHRDVERFRDLLPEDRGAVLAVPHMGNWDLAGVSAATFGFPLFYIAAHQRNPLIDAYLNRMRGYFGAETVFRGNKVIKDVLKRLKEKKILCILPDLRWRTEALSINFLGKPANMAPGMAMFAGQGNVPIFPVIVTRRGWGRHVWKLYDPIYPDRNVDKAEDWVRMTQAVMDIIDGAIREHPEQYFWYNKRWVLDPLEINSEGTAGEPQMDTDEHR